MPLVAECDACQKQYRLGDQYAGKMVKCKACGAAFRVPEPVIEPAPEPEPEPVMAAAESDASSTSESEASHESEAQWDHSSHQSSETAEAEAGEPEAAQYSTDEYAAGQATEEGQSAEFDQSLAGEEGKTSHDGSIAEHDHAAYTDDASAENAEAPATEGEQGSGEDLSANPAAFAPEAPVRKPAPAKAPASPLKMIMLLSTVLTALVVLVALNYLLKNPATLKSDDYLMGKLDGAWAVQEFWDGQTTGVYTFNHDGTYYCNLRVKEHDQFKSGKFRLDHGVIRTIDNTSDSDVTGPETKLGRIRDISDGKLVIAMPDGDASFTRN